MDDQDQLEPDEEAPVYDTTYTMPDDFPAASHTAQLLGEATGDWFTVIRFVDVWPHWRELFAATAQLPHASSESGAYTLDWFGVEVLWHAFQEELGAAIKALRDLEEETVNLTEYATYINAVNHISDYIRATYADLAQQF